MTSPWEKLLDVSRLTDVDLCAVASACQGEMYGWDAKLRAVLDRLVVQQGALSQERGHEPPTEPSEEAIEAARVASGEVRGQPDNLRGRREIIAVLRAAYRVDRGVDQRAASQDSEGPVGDRIASVDAPPPAVPPSRGVDREPPAASVAEEVIQAYMAVEAKEPGAQQRMALAIAALDVYGVGEPPSLLDGQEFYELMLAYRHAPLVDQDAVTAAFEDVKAFIRGVRAT